MDRFIRQYFIKKVQNVLNAVMAGRKKERKKESRLSLNHCDDIWRDCREHVKREKKKSGMWL